MAALALGVLDGTCGVIDAAVVHAASNPDNRNSKMAHIFIFLTSH
jgi:hypothetical protein